MKKYEWGLTKVQKHDNNWIFYNFKTFWQVRVEFARVQTRARDYVVRVNDILIIFTAMKHFDAHVNEINVKTNAFKFGDGIIEYT